MTKRVKLSPKAKSLLSNASMAAFMATGAAAPAFAQDATAPAASDEGDKIVVTGSRIARPELASPSPLTSVDSVQLSATATVNTEDYLNDLPQLIPSFDSSSNNPGDGTARLSLRGLGSKLTLILLDGKRMVPEGIGGAVDINNIPTALIERIDVVTGGASAVYGSDAVAGVVNFILKDDFEGMEVSTSYKMTGKADAGTLNLSTVMGGNFADGKGNAVLALSYTNRNALLQGDRAFSTFTNIDLGPGVPFGQGGSSSIPGVRFRGKTSSSFSGFAPPCPVFNSCSGATVSAGGTLEPFRFGTATDPANDFYNYAPLNYLQVPEERFNASAFATYEIFDGVEAYARSIFSHVLVDAQLAPTPVISEGLPGSCTSVLTCKAQHFLVVQTTNPFLFGPAGVPNGATAGSTALADLLLNHNATGQISPGNIAFRARRRYEELGNRNSKRDTSTFLIGGGVRGQFGNGWDWDVYGQYARSAVNQIQTGNISFSALFDAVYAGTANIFDGPGSLNAATVAAISRTGAIYQVTETTQILATVSGDLGWTFPMAKDSAKFAAGFEYREEASLQQPDSVLGPDVAGFNQSQFVEGN